MQMAGTNLNLKALLVKFKAILSDLCALGFIERAVYKSVATSHAGLRTREMENGSALGNGARSRMSDQA